MAIAAELRVLSGGPTKLVLGEILPAYEAALKLTIAVHYEPMGPLLAQLEAGARADVLILSAEAMVVARAKGWIDEATITEVGRVGVGVGVRAGAPLPDISTPAAFKAALLAANSVIATDPTKGTSGKQFADVLARLGIVEQVRPKLRLLDGGYGAERVAAGEAEIVVQPMTVIKSVKGVAFAGPLPGDLQKISLYSGAVTKSATDATAAKAFLAHLRSPAARIAFVTYGFED